MRAHACVCVCARGCVWTEGCNMQIRTVERYMSQVALAWANIAALGSTQISHCQLSSNYLLHSQNFIDRAKLVHNAPFEWKFKMPDQPLFSHTFLPSGATGRNGSLACQRLLRQQTSWLGRALPLKFAIARGVDRNFGSYGRVSFVL